MTCGGQISDHQPHPGSNLDLELRLKAHKYDTEVSKAFFFKKPSLKFIYLWFRFIFPGTCKVVGPLITARLHTKQKSKCQISTVPGLKMIR